MTGESYKSGMIEAFEKAGASRDKAEKVAGILIEMQKHAQYYPAPYYQQPQGETEAEPGWGRKQIALPILAAGLSGFIGYQARNSGLGNRSAWQNIKNYLIGGARKLIRQGPRPLYDIKDAVRNYRENVRNQLEDWKNKDNLVNTYMNAYDRVKAPTETALA